MEIIQKFLTMIDTNELIDIYEKQIGYTVEQQSQATIYFIELEFERRKQE